MIDQRKIIFDEAISKISAKNWTECEKLIVANPEVINYIDACNRNLVFFASQVNGSLPLMRLLVSLGSDLNLISNSGESVLTNLIDAANPIGLDTLQELEFVLTSGADPNLIGASGYPPLHWALYHNRLDHAGVLLKFGADPLKKTNDFYPEDAYEVAKGEGNSEAIQLIGEKQQEKGSEPN